MTRQVYFALVGDFIKVGCSKDPAQRVRHLRSSNERKPPGFNPRADVELLRSVPGVFRDEHRMQAALREFHVAGEWFTASPQALARIAYLTQDMPDLARASP